MDKEKFITALEEIGTCEDDAERRTKLTNLQDEIEKVYDSIATDKTTIDTLNETIKTKNVEIGNLQKANMDYFTRITNQKKEQKGDDPLLPEKEEELKFEDLFDEKGMIK